MGGGNARLNFDDELEKKGHSVTVYDVGDSFGNGYFDIICSYFVFEHLVDLDSVVQEFKAHLASFGKVIIEVPDAALYDVDHKGLQCEHQQHFQRASLKNPDGTTRVPRDFCIS